MNPIVTAVLLVSGIGLFAGVFLTLANKFMAVPENETAKKIRDVLPGANCGACGFSGCSGYADALAGSPHLKTTLCVVGGDRVAAEISAILGVEAGKTLPVRAFVRCRGTAEAAPHTAEYEGIPSCRAAAQLYGGGKACRYGCIGYGDCAAVCDRGAISLADGLAVIDRSLCLGCGKCAAACPRNLIAMLPADKEHAFVPCANTEKGPATKAVCTAGCLGCRLCAKVCEAGAVGFSDGLAVVDTAKCTGCGKCVAACKFGVMHLA